MSGNFRGASTLSYIFLDLLCTSLPFEKFINWLIFILIIKKDHIYQKINLTQRR